MIRFGGPLLTNFSEVDYDPERYALLHKEKGYRAALAPAGLNISDTDKIQGLKKAFASQDIMIAELGIYNNMLDPDPAVQKASREAVMEGLAVADAIGARCFVGILGAFAPGLCRNAHVARNFTTDALDAAVELARYFIDTVKPQNTYFTFEAFPFNIIDGPDSIAALLMAVDRERFAVHMDLVNLVNCPRKYFDSGSVTRECCRLFGDRIVSAHAKDIRMIMPSISVMMEEVIPGQGNIDMAAYLAELHKLPIDIPLLMEHLDTEEEYAQGAAFIRKTASDLNIPI